MNIFLAITMYNDKVHGKCAESIFKNSLNLIKHGHTVMPMYNSDLYIDRSRNLLVHMFLKSNCSDMVFIDSDMEFEEDSISKLLKHDKDIVAGAYRYKKDELEYTIRLDFSRNNNCQEKETGLVYVDRAPTGLMRIQRRVFEKMITHYDMIPDERKIYPFFDTGIRFEKENNWYGEDSYFCKRFIDMGGEIMVEPKLTINHIGTKEYKGNLHNFLMRRAVSNFPSDIISMPEHELDKVKELASGCSSVVEVGCWTGKSTRQLLEVCDHVYAVDTFKGSNGENEVTGIVANGKDIYKEFMDNVGDHPNLTVYPCESVEAANKMNGEKVDMVFIDANHDYKNVLEDIKAWLPKCNKIIAGHDYSNDFPGVRKAVDEMFTNANVKNSIWWVEL